MTVHDAYKAFLAADQAWSADLQRVFGSKACDVRYTDLGHAHPECKASYEQFKQAGQIWREHMTSNGKSVPLCRQAESSEA